MADEWFALASPEHFWMQWRHAGILRAVKAAGTHLERALEVGCGNGVARKMLEQDLDLTVDGCDLNRGALEMAEQGRGRLLLYDILELEPSMIGRYDAVFLLDVLEHIHDDTAFLTATLKHLRPGGVVVIDVPANMMMFSRYDTVAGHIRRYSRASLIRLLHESGVKIEGVHYWGFSMIPLLMARKFYLRMIPEADTIRAGFAPPNRPVQAGLQALKRIEMAIPFAMPLGSSLLAWGRLRAASNA